MLLWSRVASAQEALAAPTEDEILRRWVAHSREVESLRAQIRGARFDRVTASLWPNPQLQLSFLGTPAGTPPDGVVNFGAQITQPLPVFGQVRARRDAAVVALSVSEVSVAVALWNMATDLRAAMVARAFADARMTTTARNLADLARLQGIIDRRVAAGASSQYDALRVQVTAATLQAAVANAQIERARAEARLLAIVADPSLTALPITREGLAAFRGPEDLAALTTLALSRRPDLELARRGVRLGLANAQRWRRDATPVPSVWLGAYGTHDADSVSVTAGLSFTLPVFDRNQGLVGRAESETEGQRALEEALTTRVRVEVAGAWRGRESAREALARFQQTGVGATEALLRRAEVTYESGGAGSATFTIVDLLDAYRTQWDTRTQELALQQTFAEAEADLERAAALVSP